MESVSCNVCGGTSATVLFAKRDKFGIASEPFRVVRCGGCGLMYVNPRPSLSELVKYYPETYSWKETFEAADAATGLIRKAERAYRLHLLRYEVNKVLRRTGLTRGRMLDIGCGTGDRLKLFREKGFETYGVEFSSSARHARDVLKLNVIEGDVSSARFPDAFFDLVTLFNVLEHTGNPQSVLMDVRRILKPGGAIVVQVPNADSLQFRLFRRRWAAVDVPRDLYYFTPRAISRYFAACGFEPTAVDHFNNWWHPPTIVTTLFPSLDPQFSWRDEHRAGANPLRRLAWAGLTCTLGTFTFLESVCGRGAIVMHFGRIAPDRRMTT